VYIGPQEEIVAPYSHRASTQPRPIGSSWWRPAGCRRSGFTLIELMLTLAIIGVLSAVAIPMLISYQLRSKAAEGVTNIAAIQKAVDAYYAEYSVYVSAMPATPAAVGPIKQPWGIGPNDPHGFNDLGYAPEGQVYFQYGVTSDGNTAYTIGARSDIDADGGFNTWGYVKPTGGTGAGVVGPFSTCAATGVLDPITLVPNRLNLVGPCDLPSSSGAY
jgi:prepilin-type N-terminal cleavage/methylation domain-containing protein